MMKENEDIINQYVRERDQAVSTFDLATFRKFLMKWQKEGMFPFDVSKITKPVLEITMYKMAVHSINIAPEKRKQAEKWLLDHGYDLGIGRF